jgi:hypothetical protein
MVPARGLNQRDRLGQRSPLPCEYTFNQFAISRLHAIDT